MGLRFRVLGSGSSGNSTLVDGDGTRVLIDAGLGSRELAERLESAGVDPASVDAVLLSHEHGDHSRGAASFSRRWGVRLRGTRGTYAAAGLGAVDIAGYDAFVAGTRFRIGALTIMPVPVPHDAAEPVAFVVSSGDDCLGHATDLGHMSRAVVDAFRGCTAILVESNFDPGLLRDGPYPWSLKERILGRVGHLSNGDVARYLADGLPGSCGTLVLAHLSLTNNHPELVRMTADAALRGCGRADVRLELTGPDGTGWIEAGGAAAKPLGQMRLW